jgi:(p)ppGpp synthase/HD superfamily hydrolase
MAVEQDDFEMTRSNLPLDEVGFMDYESDYKDARSLAKKYHGMQKYGSHPYTKHLNDVDQALRRFGYDPDNGDDESRMLAWDLVTAAWLHDIIEDTSVTRSQISRKFNHRVAGMVYAVTNPQGGNRKWRASKVYPKITRTPHALTLKLADRVANVESCVENKSGLINMYKKEWKDFKSKYRNYADPAQPWYKPGEHEDMWKALDKMLRR